MSIVKLEILHWLFESQDPSVITSVLGSDCVCFNHDHDRYGIQPFDWHVLGYCITHSSCDWKLELSKCKLESVETFLRALHLQHDPSLLPSTGKISGVVFWVSDPAAVHLLVSSMPTLLVFSNLTQLGLMSSNITSETCNLLSKHTDLLQNLEYLNLFNNRPIGRGGAVTLITSLTQFGTIRELNLDATGIGFEDCKALSELLASSKYMKVLDIGGNDLSPDSIQCIIDGLSRNTSLEELGMYNSNFSSENTLHLASVLKVNTRLKWLDISVVRCGIQSSDSVHLAKALEENTTTQLQTLWLIGNPIGSEGAVAFADMLATNKSLTYLNMSCCDIQKESAVAFASTLKKNQCLKTLDLSDDSVGVEGALELIESLKHNTTLKELVLSEKCRPPSFYTLINELNVSSFVRFTQTQGRILSH